MCAVLEQSEQIFRRHRLVAHKGNEISAVCRLPETFFRFPAYSPTYLSNPPHRSMAAVSISRRSPMRKIGTNAAAFRMPPRAYMFHSSSKVRYMLLTSPVCSRRPEGFPNTGMDAGLT